MEHKKYFKKHIFRHLATIPFIYAVFIPLVIFDITVEIYHHVCFRLYKIPIINRKKYVKIDRYKIPNLDVIQKIHCAYCGYANGVINYITQIFAETEKYWCGIQHKKDSNFIAPEHHKCFIAYDKYKD